MIYIYTMYDYSSSHVLIKCKRACWFSLLVLKYLASGTKISNLYKLEAWCSCSVCATRLLCHLISIMHNSCKQKNV